MIVSSGFFCKLDTMRVIKKLNWLVHLVTQKVGYRFILNCKGLNTLFEVSKHKEAK